MSNILIKIIVVYLFLFNVLCKNDKEDIGNNNDDLTDKYKNEFNSNVITYLKDNFLYKNEVVIVDKKAFRKIFKDIMNLEGAKVFEIYKKIYNKVVEEIIKEAYPKKKKHIIATQLDIIFEYDHVMNKFNDYVSKHKNVEDL